jgi:hypothetical protein
VDQAVSEQLFGADAGAGFDEGVDAGAFAVPFLVILQALSPAVQQGKPEFIEEARPGMLMNSLTKALAATIDVSVVRRTHTMCVWNKREDGGGFITEFEATTDAVMEFQGLERDEKNRAITKEDKEMTEHRNFYCQIVDSQTGTASEPLLVSLTKSQLKAAREWNSLISLRSARVGENKAPVAPSEIWRLGTVLRTKGENSWFALTVTHVTRHSNPAIYAEVRAAIPVAKEFKLLARPRTDDEETAEGEGAEV